MHQCFLQQHAAHPAERGLACLTGLKRAEPPPFSRSACVGTQPLLHAGNCVKAQVLLLAVSFRYSLLWVSSLLDFGWERKLFSLSLLFSPGTYLFLLSVLGEMISPHCCREIASGDIFSEMYLYLFSTHEKNNFLVLDSCVISFYYPSLFGLCKSATLK